MSDARIHSTRCLTIAMALLAVLGLAADVMACSVCQGDPDSDLSKGAQAGVLFMVIVTYGLLLGFAGLAALWFVRVRRLRTRGLTGSTAASNSPDDSPNSP